MNQSAASILLSIPKEMGRDIAPGSTILDFGCGAGKTVSELQGYGFQAYGCDFDVVISDTDKLAAIRAIETEPYKLPFEDNTFDFIYSNQVFEHVQNYSESLAEIKRVLKADGCCLHIFPARNKVIEVHVFVPFSSIIRSYMWMLMWAKLGIRNRFQGGKSATETATDNQQYLNTCTNYLSKRQLSQEFGTYFNEVVFCEICFLKNTSRGKKLYPMFKVLPFLTLLYSTFRTRVVFMRDFPLK